MVNKHNLSDKYPNIIALIVLSFWLISQILAPFLIPSNSVNELEGYSNILDHQSLWDDLPVYPRFIYVVGDVMCHQKTDRSILLNGNQMPICARCLSVYFGLFIALLFTLTVSNQQTHNEYLYSMFPKKARTFLKKTIEKEFLPMIIIGLFLAPIAIDGGLQLFTSYESSFFTRILTGFPAGWIGGILLGAVINT